MARDVSSGNTNYDQWPASGTIVLNIGAGDFTFGGWGFVTALANGSCLLTMGVALPMLESHRASAQAWRLIIAPSTFGFDTIPTTGRWDHYAVRRLGTTVSGWYNGVQDATTHTISTSIADANVRGGYAGTGGTRALEGHSAELFIANRAWSADEIAAAAGGASPDHFPDGLVWYADCRREPIAKTDNRAVTTNGSVVASNFHPPVYYPSSSMVAVPAAVGGPAKKRVHVIS